MIIKSIKTRGFTLLEMLVSLGIFAIVAVIAVGSLVRITGLNRQAQSLQASMNNIAFALESISRDMRVGTNYQGGGNTVTFDSSKSSVNGSNTCQLRYSFGFFPSDSGNGLSLKKAEESSCNGTLTYYPILDESNMTLTDYRLDVLSEPDGYDRVFIRLIGYSGTKENERNNFDIQTSVSSRISN